MQQIPLTKGQFALVDDVDDAALRAVGSWSYAKPNEYAVHYYTDADGKHRTLYQHRAVMQRILGHAIPAGYQVDHIDRDRLNNQRSNLRLATRSQNQANKGVAKNNTSDYKGVSHNQGKWEARIRFDGKRIHLGRYTNAEEAALMYDAASRELYKDFAGLNFPDMATPSRLVNAVQEVLTRYKAFKRSK